ncbi:hypothetical protein [Marinobacterium jannaschii]|uniref:hypothetical protein n=1 Tax=Marinobacterium jannaschii TaxID=64970 RepID=UPI0012EB2697|nr:hypothetical protein [Marinobacterium jannaschii]
MKKYSSTQSGLTWDIFAHQEQRLSSPEASPRKQQNAAAQPRRKGVTPARHNHC